MLGQTERVPCHRLAQQIGVTRERCCDNVRDLGGEVRDVLDDASDYPFDGIAARVTKSRHGQRGPHLVENRVGVAKHLGADGDKPRRVCLEEGVDPCHSIAAERELNDVQGRREQALIHQCGQKKSDGERRPPFSHRHSM